MLPIELYIHIPFCVKKCAYCDFLSAPSTKEEREFYVKLLCREIRVCQNRMDGYEVCTIFFGGGTPSLLTGEQMERIIAELRGIFSFASDIEITMEMNPGTVTKEKLICYRKAGINRLSIGLQSVHNEELKMLGRIYTYEKFLEAYQMSRESGYDNINIDLISAIPGQTVESWEKTLRTIAALSPEHISAYSLILEPGTPFYELYEEDKYESGSVSGSQSLPDEETERQMYWLTEELLHQAGYERYEISNYARSGCECRHNLGYWNRTPYLGFGIGAASLVPENLIEENQKEASDGDTRQIRMSRYTNPEYIEVYQNCFMEKFCGQMLTKNEEMEEFMFLGLRKMEGVSPEKFEQQFGNSMESVYGQVLEKMKEEGLMEMTEDQYRLTERGIDISNYVMSEFLL